MNFGQNLYNWFLSNAQSLVLMAIVVIGIYLGFKREFSKLIGFLVVALVAVGLVFNASGVKDVLSQFSIRLLEHKISIAIVRTFAYNKDKSVQMENSDSEEWLDFILNCRSGKDSTDYDLVVGGVANDKVFNTVELFFDRLIDKTEAINRLRYEKPNLQICFRTEKALSLLHFEGSETL